MGKSTLDVAFKTHANISSTRDVNFVMKINVFYALILPPTAENLDLYISYLPSVYGNVQNPTPSILTLRGYAILRLMNQPRQIRD